MPSPRLALTIPIPCTEPWSAMTSTGDGRHCAACQKTVVDFTLKTDAEILAYLARVAGETCGRFGSDQLNRPLLPAASLPPHNRWQAWLAVVLAAWGLRVGTAEAAGSRALAPPSTLPPPRKAGPTHLPARPGSKRLHGVVRNADTHQAITGVAVFLKGENRMAITDAEGRFSLFLPDSRAHHQHTLALHRADYQSKIVSIPVSEARPFIRVELHGDLTEVMVVAPYQREQRQMLSGAVASVVAAEEITQAVPQQLGKQPGSFLRWLTKPFRRRQKLND